MNPAWKEALAACGANEAGSDFGDAAAETVAAAIGTVVCPLVDRGFIRAAGADAADFLHNLLTNDISGIAPDGIQRAGFCTPKGRLLADFLVWRDGEDYFLQLSSDILPAILKKLSMYVLRAKVKLSDVSGERLAIGLAGPGADTILHVLQTDPPTDMRHSPIVSGGQVLGLGGGQWQLVVPAEAAATLFRRLADLARPIGTLAWHSLDITRGIPTITVPLQEQFVPQMLNFELIGGVGFKKGCYPGQEIVARTQYLGKIKKRMYRARLVEGHAAVGEALYAPETGDQVCGNVVAVAPSPAGGLQMLLVAPASVADAGEIHLRAPDGPRLELLDLPYPIS